MRSYRYGRYRKLRWCGLFLALVLLAALAVATLGSVTIRRGDVIAGLFRGSVSCKRVDPHSSQFLSEAVLFRWRPSGAPPLLTWWPGFVRPTPGVWRITIPLWIPLLGVAIPTIVLWQRDRRFPPGHCPSCGYDLTGNKSGVCPECGTGVIR